MPNIRVDCKFSFKSHKFTKNTIYFFTLSKSASIFTYTLIWSQWVYEYLCVCVCKTAVGASLCYDVVSRFWLNRSSPSFHLPTLAADLCWQEKDNMYYGVRGKYVCMCLWVCKQIARIFHKIIIPLGCIQEFRRSKALTKHIYDTKSALGLYLEWMQEVRCIFDLGFGRAKRRRCKKTHLPHTSEPIYIRPLGFLRFLLPFAQHIEPIQLSRTISPLTKPKQKQQPNIALAALLIGRSSLVAWLRCFGVSALD